MRLIDRLRQDQRSVFPVLWTVFFFQGMALGSWLPALTNMFAELGISGWVPLAFMIPPLCAMISPVIGGALADQRVPADRLYAWASLVSSVLLALSFWCLDLGLSPMWFMSILAVNALVSAPTWGLLSTVSLKHLDPPERRFPLVRVGATIGWIAGGVVVSYGMQADSSPTAGYAAAVWRLASALVAFALPHTPPLGVVRDWRSRWGMDAFALLKQRDHLVFFLVTGLYSIPISAFYMYGPEFLAVLGDPRPTGTMTVAQVLEIASMLLLGTVLARHSVKAVLLWALGLSVLRFAMSAQAGVGGSGGAGGNSGTETASGGAGGGAILIAAAGTITVDGEIRANGGLGNAPSGPDGASGSGGGIRLVADLVEGAGKLRAVGGQSNLPGGAGRIRVEANTVDMADVGSPAYAVEPPAAPPEIWQDPSATPCTYCAGSTPVIRVVDVDGVSVPANPSSRLTFPDEDVRMADPDPVTVTIETENVPSNWNVVVRAVPHSGLTIDATAMFQNTAGSVSTWTADITLPNGFATMQARASAP